MPDPRRASVAIAADPDHEVFLFRFEGTLAAAQLRAGFTLPAAGRLYRTGMVVITDFREALLDASYAEMQVVMKRIDKAFRATGAPSAGAIVAPADVSFGLSHMYKLLTGDTYPTLSIFREWNDAMRWLELDPSVVEALVPQLMTFDLMEPDDPQEPG